MVIRDFIQCMTCDQVHTVRVSVGHNSIQRHDFSCFECHEPIGIAMNVDLDKITAEIVCYENSEKSNVEGVIINLNPHFMIDQDATNDDLSFPWMFQAQALMANDIKPILLQDNRMAEEIESLVGLKFGGSNFGDIYEQLGGLSRITDYWALVKKAWSLTNNKKNGLADRVLKKYDAPAFSGNKRFNIVVEDFVYRLTLPRAYVLTDLAIIELKKANVQNPEALRAFAKYYVDNLRKNHMKRYFDCLSEFFESYSEYDQAILYTKNRSPVPDGHIATSYGFNKTKMFYGNAYESFTTNISLLACLNNILSGRSFDKFENMNLDKYLTINKANRGNPFKSNDNLALFLECADSTLRNASHHNSMELIDQGKNIQFQSGGTGAIQKITYANYLEKCNSILLSIASLFLFENELRKYI